ncbi:MAG TPA: bifunctional DNA primase/polymerase [Nitrososphaera sp.]|nr:bifunctional DNA primase/polymerase [Nitrososphaera sp.]
MIVPLANTKTLRDYVNEYVDVGVRSLIPLKHGTKNKILVDWKQYQRKLPTASERESWFFSTGELRNVAAVLGQTARLVAIDVDGDAAKQRVARKLVELGYCNNLRVAMLHTMMNLTGSGGFHFLFRVNPWLFEDYDLRTKTLWYDANAKHCEIKFLGEGHIVILAPSLHPNGVGRYLWNGKAPIELSATMLRQLLEVFSERYLPTTLDEVHQQAANTDVGHIVTDGNNEPSSISDIRQSILLDTNLNSLPSLSPEKTQNLITALKSRYTTGRRHKITLGYAGGLRKYGYTLKAVEDFCVAVCRTFSDEEIEFRLRDVRDTFAKPLKTGREIAGWSMLNDIE